MLTLDSTPPHSSRTLPSQQCPQSTTLVSASLPSPDLNSLQPTESKIWSALLQNALALDIDLEFLVRTCTSLTQFYMFPWYRPGVMREHDLGRLLSAVPSPIPSSFRPTIAKILIPHHVSLYLIPFLQFRDRAIMLGAALPHFFSLHELKRDIYGKDARVWVKIAHSSGIGDVGRHNLGF
jgi:hypothetical protein